MTISKKIRNYTLGFLFLMMAALIINATMYIADLIPDVTLSPSAASVKSTGYLPAKLVVARTAQDENRTLIGSSYMNYKNIGLSSPDPGRAWLIVFPTPSANITPYVSGSLAKHTNAGGDTYILWRDKITEISIYISTEKPPRLPLKIYSVDANIPVPPPSDYLNPPPQQDTRPVEISNKTIIVLVGWTTGIILAIIGLSKFDISI